MGTVLSDLPRRQAEAITLRHAEGESESDTARIMGISTRRVRYLISEARRRLACRGIAVPPLPVGRPKSSTATGDSFNFDDI